MYLTGSAIKLVKEIKEPNKHVSKRKRLLFYLKKHKKSIFKIGFASVVITALSLSAYTIYSLSEMNENQAGLISKLSKKLILTSSSNKAKSKVISNLTRKTLLNKSEAKAKQVLISTLSQNVFEIHSDFLIKHWQIEEAKSAVKILSQVNQKFSKDLLNVLIKQIKQYNVINCVDLSAGNVALENIVFIRNHFSLQETTMHLLHEMLNYTPELLYEMPI